MYRLDKKSHKTSTLREASFNYYFWKNKTVTERLSAAIYLIKTAYRIDEFPPMDKTIHSTRKLTNE